MKKFVFVVLMLLVGGWGVVAVALANRLAPSLAGLGHPRVFQSFTGATPPGADFRPLHVTVGALLDPGDAIRATDGRFVLIRSMRTMTAGPTAPLEFTMSDPPTEAAVVAWLGDFGVDTQADDARAAAREALAVVGAAARARTAEALHGAPTDVAPRVHADDLVRLDARTPAWAEATLVIALALAGAIPILVAVLRVARRP